MNILIHPHELRVGGSQTNAIELAAAVRDLGHEVTIVANHGPLVERIEGLGLNFVQLGKAGDRRRFRTSVRRLRPVIRRGNYDVLHTYEFRACMEAWAALGLRARPPLMCTDMSMGVHKRFPRTVPLVLGTRALSEEAERLGVRRVFTMEPPVDTEANHPSVDGREFLREHELEDSELKVVIVSRLMRHLKLEGIERTIEAVSRLAADLPLRLVIVGEGECLADLQEAARRVNGEIGRAAVILTGPMIDPRPAYAVADVVVGMGHSALRGMAFGKPVVVVGGGGYSEIVSPASIDHFRQVGFYSVGSEGDPESRLRCQLTELLGSESRRMELGRFGRDVAVSEYGLAAAARMLETIYQQLTSRRSFDGAWLDDTRNLIVTLGSGKAKFLRTRMPGKAVRRGVR